MSGERVEERFVEMEMKLAYQDHTVGELNSTILTLVNRVDFLEREVKLLKERLSVAGGSHIRDLSEESPPPHY